MIALPTQTRIWIAAGVTDLRRGFTGLSALVQTKLEQSAFSGQVFVFRGPCALDEMRAVSITMRPLSIDAWQEVCPVWPCLIR